MKTQQSACTKACSTDKGRKACVARIDQLAKEHGATIALHEFNGPREIGLDIEFGPYRCMIHFDGSERIGAFLGHWHTTSASDAKYPKTFATAIRGSLNTFHFSKATTCEETFDGFIRSLDGGLSALARDMAEQFATVA